MMDFFHTVFEGLIVTIISSLFVAIAIPRAPFWLKAIPAIAFVFITILLLTSILIKGKSNG